MMMMPQAGLEFGMVGPGSFSDPSALPPCYLPPSSNCCSPISPPLRLQGTRERSIGRYHASCSRDDGHKRMNGECEGSLINDAHYSRTPLPATLKNITGVGILIRCWGREWLTANIITPRPLTRPSSRARSLSWCSRYISRVGVCSSV